MSTGNFDDKTRARDSLLFGEDDSPILETRTETQSHGSYRTRHGRGIRLVMIFIVTFIVTIACLDWLDSTPSHSSACHSADANPEEVWGSIEPSSKLKWVPCYENRECARLAVPLDYDDVHGPQAAVALIKKASKISPNDKGYRGPILFNPGGPGGSGVDMVRGRGDQFAKLLGDDYDIIGFDPRGIGRTTPKVSAFLNEAEATTFNFKHEYDPPLNATADALARAYARSDVLGSLARERSGFAAQYTSTAFVAHDMLSISRAHGYEKLQYWGFSYGSVLGITYAAMFPDNIERLVVDGVCDTYNYYETQWSNNLRDTDAGLRNFLESCVAAGSDGCALHDSSADKIAARLEGLYASLKQHPLSVAVPRNATGVSSIDYGILDYKAVRGAIFQFLYKPYAPGPLNATALATALAAAERGDGRLMWQLVKNGQTEFNCKCDDSPVALPASGRELTLAVACSDGDVVEDSLEELYEHYERMAKDSSFAELWDIRLECSAWKVRAKRRFNGPFVGNTSHPILLVGNTADPVTPLWNANKMAKGFKGAVVLTQNSPGHCSLAATSICTAKAIREYFREGKTPAPGTVCQVEDQMFGAPNSVHANLVGEDRELIEAMRELSAEFEVPIIHA